LIDAIIQHSTKTIGKIRMIVKNGENYSLTQKKLNETESLKIYVAPHFAM